MSQQRKLRMGMVGGGPGAFIGPVHRIAAELDGKIELVAGAFSQSPERSRIAGESFRIDPARAYANYQEMMEAERRRTDPIDFVAIVTPNHLHLPIAAAALAAGFPVMSDKPATATYAEAEELEKLVAKSGLPYGLTHTYAGYGLIREARAICATGQLGKIRKIAVEYLQGWLSRPIETTGQKQAAWRSDPAQNGPGGRSESPAAQMARRAGGNSARSGKLFERGRTRRNQAAGRTPRRLPRSLCRALS